MNKVKLNFDTDSVRDLEFGFHFLSLVILRLYVRFLWRCGKKECGLYSNFQKTQSISKSKHRGEEKKK